MSGEIFTKDPKRFSPVLPGPRDTPTGIREQAKLDDDNRFNLTHNRFANNVIALESSASHDTNIIYTSDDFWPLRVGPADAQFYKMLRSICKIDSEVDCELTQRSFSSNTFLI